MKARLPRTPGEWKEAVNMAELLVWLDSVKQYGLIKGGPKVNIDRCLYILSEGRRIGHFPLPVDQLMDLYLPVGKSED
jgi:hypothetical protein